jgi:hypothetical protein
MRSQASKSPNNKKGIATRRVTKSADKPIISPKFAKTVGGGKSPNNYRKKQLAHSAS